MGSVRVSSCRCCMFVYCVHPVAVLNAFMICRGLCACTEMLWMCVSFGSKVGPRTFGCVAMGSALLCILGPDC